MEGLEERYISLDEGCKWYRSLKYAHKFQCGRNRASTKDSGHLKKKRGDQTCWDCKVGDKRTLRISASRRDVFIREQASAERGPVEMSSNRLKEKTKKDKKEGDTGQKTQEGNRNLSSGVVSKVRFQVKYGTWSRRFRPGPAQESEERHSASREEDGRHCH